MNNYPDSFLSLQLHIGDGFGTSWTQQRWNFYSGTGTPLTWFDGVLQCSGAYTNDTQMYNWYNTQRTTRANVATDISLEIFGEEVSAQTYEITVNVTMDPDGTEREIKLHVVQALDYYPSSTDNRYRNCAVQHAPSSFMVAPGETVPFTTTFTLSGASWTYHENAKIIAFARETGTPAPKEIYNSAIMGWPFTSPAIEGDVDGDGDVDLSDLAGLLSSYGLCAGDTGYNDAADFVDDDCIDLSDLAALLANYGYGVP